MEQLTGLDASFLNLETGPSTGHVGSLSMYDASAAPGGSVYEALRRTLRERIHLLQPFRRKLVEVPLGLDHPYWIEDPDFDLEFHLRQIAVPPPGTDAQLAELVARLHARPLDRSRPLWEIYVIEGLSEARVAVYIKIHHATIDGVSGVELTTALLDLAPEGAPADPAPPPLHRDREPSQLEMLARGLTSLALQPRKMWRFGAKTARALYNLRPAEIPMIVRGTPFLNRLPGFGLPAGARREDAPPIPQTPAPRTPFNRSITPHRRFAFASLPLGDAKRVKNAFGTTLNDVVMAMSATALRRYLESKDALPEDPLIAMVPVSVRSRDERATYSNRVSSVLAELATDEPDPVERLLRIHHAMKSAKRMQEAIPADLLQDFTQFATPMIAARAARIIARTRILDRANPPFNVVISNVPGPREPLYCGGVPLRHFYPVSAVTHSQGLNITVQSYLDQLDFGLVSCRELVPDLWDLMGYLCQALDELLERAAVEETRTSAPAAPPAVARATASAAAPVQERSEIA